MGGSGRNRSRLLALLSVILVSSLLLNGCAPNTWAPAPGQSDQSAFSTLLRCQKQSDVVTVTIPLVPTPASIAAAGLATAIAAPFQSRMLLDACMENAGFVSVEPSRFARAVEERRECVDIVRLKPRYAAIVPHLSPIGTATFTLQQLADETVPTAQDAQDLASYAGETRPCYEHYAQSVAAITPASGPIIEQENSDIDAIYVQLEQRQLTWGQFGYQQQRVVTAAIANLHKL
jgi:hypothetical protein